MTMVAPQQYSGECRRCERTVSKVFESVMKTPKPGHHIRCKHCERTVWCTPDTM